MFIFARLPAYGVNLESLGTIKIPSEQQIFDSYFPKLAALNLAIDTAGVLLRIDRIVKGTNLFSVEPTSAIVPQGQTQETQEAQEAQETEEDSDIPKTRTLYQKTKGGGGRGRGNL